jgi:hypothetical protein
LAFQLADDIQDHDPNRPEKVSFVSALGEEETRRLLEQTSAEARDCLAIFDDGAQGLREMVEANLKRI